MGHALWELVDDECTAEQCVIRDRCVGKTVTNNAESVVNMLLTSGRIKPGMRLFYYDSECNRDELLFDERGFNGFVASRGDQTVMRLEPGVRVYCDMCGQEFTDSPLSGGFYGLGTKAVGPCCDARLTVQCTKHGETKEIKSRCPEGVSFADWVRSALR